jgi:hypothetical protein
MQPVSRFSLLATVLERTVRRWRGGSGIGERYSARTDFSPTAQNRGEQAMSIHVSQAHDGQCAARGRVPGWGQA